MNKVIETFEDACEVLNLDATTIIPNFSLFPQEDQEAMIAHAKLIIITKAINGDWVPDWTKSKWDKYFPWFVMGSSSGVGFSFFVAVRWSAYSTVGSRLCFKTSEKAEHAGKQFIELYKAYFVKA